METIVLFGISVDEPPISRTGAGVPEMRTTLRGWVLFRSGQGTAPFDPAAVRTKASSAHRLVSQADGHPLFKAQRTSIAQIALIALVEGDDQSHLPAFITEAIKSQRIVSLVKGSGLEGQGNCIDYDKGERTLSK